MRKSVIEFLELASIDLSYAELEIRFADQPTKALDNIGYHLNELKKHLSELASSTGCAHVGVDDEAGVKSEMSECAPMIKFRM